MGDVVEQRGDECPAGDDEPGKEIERGQPAQPAQQQPLDEEQLRQFQQFQQFQDYLKLSEAQQQAGGQLVSQQPRPPVPHQTGQPTPPGLPPGELVPAGPPRLKVPGWLKWLGRKILGWVVLLVILGLAAAWLLHHYFPSNANDNRPAAETGGGTYHTNQLLSKNPYEAVRAVYDAIGKNNPDPKSMVDKACGPMREDAQQAFARDLNFQDCAQAVLALHAKVTNLNAYIESIPSYISEPSPGNTVTISSCAFGVRGGPALGAFTVTQVENGQWLITDHTNEPDPCPAPTTSAAPSTQPAG
jgi:hypothetical protein